MEILSSTPSSPREYVRAAFQALNKQDVKIKVLAISILVGSLFSPFYLPQGIADYVLVGGAASGWGLWFSSGSTKSEILDLPV